MKTDTDFNINRVIKYAIITMFVIVVMVIIMVLAKIWFIYSTFGYFTYKISSAFGADLMLSRVVAAMATVIALIFIPWIMVFLFFGKKKKEILYATVIVGSVCFLAVYFGTGNVFFDRVTGQPARYYIKTLEGFKFSMNEDFDPKFGIKYKLINQEIVKEYLFWEDFGKQRSIPEVKPGKYFDMLTGEPIVWYIEKAGAIHLFSLPGHDPATGRALKPITQEVADRIEMEKKELKPTKNDDAITFEGAHPAVYFESRTGEPVVWYVQLPDGVIELSLKPGFHTQTKGEFQPITIEMAEQARQYFAGKERRLNEYINSYAEKANKGKTWGYSNIFLIFLLAMVVAVIFIVRWRVRKS